jgi:hypothetical protein
MIVLFQNAINLRDLLALILPVLPKVPGFQRSFARVFHPIRPETPNVQWNFSIRGDATFLQEFGLISHPIREGL